MNNLNNVQNTWEKIKFADIMSPAKVVLCGNRQDLPVLSITMHDGIIEQKDRFKKVIASHDTSKYKVIKNGQLVIAFPIDEGLIYTQDVAPEGIMSPAYNVWDVNYECFDRRFLGLYFHSPFAMAYYKNNLRGTTQRRRALPKEVLLSMSIPKPSLSKQKEIVSELDSINESITLLQQQVKDLDALAQSLFYDMFGGPITNPKGWEVKALGDICVEKKKIKRASKCFDSSEEISYIDISSIDQNTNSLTGFTSYVFGEAPSRAQQKVEKGDVLISLVRPNLRNIALVDSGENNLVASSGFCVLRANNSSNLFIKYLVLTPHFTEYLVKRVSGANYPAVREEDIKGCMVGVPPLSLQQAFADRITAIEESKNSLSTQISELQTLLASRMQYWFD